MGGKNEAPFRKQMGHIQRKIDEMEWAGREIVLMLKAVHDRRAELGPEQRAAFDTHS